MSAADEWSRQDAAQLIARPGATDDKYSRGVLGVVTGSDTYPGAAVLGVEAALATGVGMVRYLGPERPAGLVLAACPEAVTAPGRVQAWLAGSGMGEMTPTLRATVLEGELPRVLDAGALDLVREATGPVVITPHHRELARLTGSTAQQVGDDPEGAALNAARSLGAVVLLKGSRTVVATPSGELLRCPPATPWLATAGTGDVLAGILGALVATHAAGLSSPAAVDGSPDSALDGAMGGALNDAQWRMLARLAASAAVIHAEAAARASGGGPFTVRALLAAIPGTVAGLLE